MKDLGLKRWVQSNIYIRILGILREADVDRDAITGTQVERSFDAYEGLLEAHRYLDYDDPAGQGRG